MLSRGVIQLATVLFLLIGFIFTSASALSYWREVTVSRDVELVTIGEPVEIIIEDLNDHTNLQQLVPMGYVMTVGETEEVVLEYQVSVSRELLNTVDLIVNVDNILINNDTTYSHLVEFDVMGFGEEAKLDLFNSALLITVRVRLTEPIDLDEAIDNDWSTDLVNVVDSQEAFLQLKGQAIKFTLSFELQTKENIQEELT